MRHLVDVVSISVSTSRDRFLGKAQTVGAKCTLGAGCDCARHSTYGTELTGLDLSGATALVSIGGSAFISTGLMGLNLSGVAKLEAIGDHAFLGTKLTGTLKVGSAIKTIGAYAFSGTELTGLDLSGATALVSIGDYAFSNNIKLTSIDLSGAADRAQLQVDWERAFHGNGNGMGNGLNGTILTPGAVYIQY